jgi:hypothetical protein
MATSGLNMGNDRERADQVAHPLVADLRDLMECAPKLALQSGDGFLVAKMDRAGCDPGSNRAARKSNGNTEATNDITASRLRRRGARIGDGLCHASLGVRGR